MLPFPSAEEARQILETRTETLAKAQKDGLPENYQVALYRFRDWAKILKDSVDAGIRSASVPLNLQAFKIGDIAFATAAAETLVELGLGVKKASPFPNTIFLGYSNGCIGYLPPAEAYPPGGWSPWETYSIPDLLFQSYQLPMALDPGCGQKVVDSSVALLKALST
jgi:hypothetical protein